MCKLYLGHLQELEKKLCGDIAAAKRDDPFYPVIVLVENNLAGVYLRRALGRCRSYCRVRFMTLSGLAAELAGETPEYASRKTMPPYGEEWLAALTAREAAGGYFGPVAGRPGFRKALRRTFQELEEAGLKQLPHPPGGDPDRIEELQRLYDRYRELRRPFACREEAFAAAAKAKPAEPFFLALYGIYILSALERELLASLAARAKISVYWQETAASLAPVKETLQWYEEQDFLIERLSPPPHSRGNLARLQGSLYQFPPEDSGVQAGGDASLEFICAPDEIREAEEITREIIRLARAGVRFGEMAVLLPNRAYGRLIRERLDAAGIPSFIAGGEPLANTRTGRSFLLLLQLIGSDYSRLKVMELLTYAPFDYRRLLEAEAPVSPSFWDFLTVQAGVIKGRRQWREALERYRRQILAQPREKDDDDSTAEEEKAADRARSRLQAVEMLLAFLEKLFGALERFESCHSWTGLSNLAEEFAVNFFYPGDEREALCRFLKGLSQLDNCGGDFELNIALHLLQSAMQATTLPAGRFQQEGVNLMPLSSAAGLCFTALFIPGLAEKIIPAPVHTDPLLPETERLALEGALPLRRRQIEIEALRFALALGGALRKAVLTWPRTSAAGSREQLPSFFLSRCGEALLGSRPGYEQLSLLPGYRYIPSAVQEETVADPITAAEYDLACCSNLPAPLQPVQYYSRLSPELALLLEADLARRSRRLTPFDGLFTPQGAARLLLAARLGGSGGRFSATALEDYARCPLSYFLKRLLKLAPLEEPEELLEMAPLQRGLLVHRILEQFYRRAAAEGLFPVERHPSECRSLLEQAAAEELEALPPEELPPYPLLRQLQQRTLLEMLQALLDWEIETAAGFTPVEFELAFGFNGSEEQVTLSLPSGEKLSFQGRIDRVDRSGSRIRVIDYKTGRKRIKNESLAGGEALQLPVYLLAAAVIFNLPRLEEVEAYAYHLSPAGVKTVLFSGSSWPEKERLLQETLAALYEGIAAGRFFPYPGPSCRFCDYRDLCGPGIERTFRRKAGDPALAAFQKLKEEKT